MRHFTLALMVLAAAACGPKNSSSGHDQGIPEDGGSDDLSVNGDANPPVGTLEIMPLNPVVNVVAGTTPPTVQFMADVGGTPVAASWAVDRGEIGSISGTGLFTTPGTAGGQATVSAVYNSDKVTTTITVKLSRTDVGDPAFGAGADAGAGGYGGVGGDGPGGPVSTGEQQALTGTSTFDGTVKLLYPYDQTVWPRGLLAPLIQWDPGTHHFDAAYVHITENNYEYKGFFAANLAGDFKNLPLPQAAWDELTFSNGGEPVMVSIVLGEGGAMYGPYNETWKVAPATLKGTVY